MAHQYHEDYSSTTYCRHSFSSLPVWSLWRHRLLSRRRGQHTGILHCLRRDRCHIYISEKRMKGSVCPRETNRQLRLRCYEIIPCPFSDVFFYYCCDQTTTERMDKDQRQSVAPFIHHENLWMLILTEGKPPEPLKSNRPPTNPFLKNFDTLFLSYNLEKQRSIKIKNLNGKMLTRAMKIFTKIERRLSSRYEQRLKSSFLLS